MLTEYYFSPVVQSDQQLNLPLLKKTPHFGNAIFLLSWEGEKYIETEMIWKMLQKSTWGGFVLLLLHIIHHFVYTICNYLNGKWN